MFSFKEKLKGFIIGSITTTIIFTSMLGFAESQRVDAFITGIKVMINGQELKSDVQPVIVNGRTMLPVRAIADTFGYEINWDGNTNTVEIKNKAVDNNGDVLPTKDIQDSVNNSVYNDNRIMDNDNLKQISNNNSTNNDFVFRKVNWGMNKEQVIKSEEKETKTISDLFITYEDIIGNIDTKITYAFNEFNQLCGIMLNPQIVHSNYNSYIDDYDYFKSILSQKYGNMLYDDDMIWNDNLYKNDSSKYGIGVASGRLKYMSKWSLADTNIYNMLTGDNFDIKLVIMFESKNIYQPIENTGF